LFSFFFGLRAAGSRSQWHAVHQLLDLAPDIRLLHGTLIDQGPQIVQRAANLAFGLLYLPPGLLDPIKLKIS